jgi:hypothetical protein
MLMMVDIVLLLVGVGIPVALVAAGLWRMRGR